MSLRKIWILMVVGTLILLMVVDFVQDYKVYKHAQNVEQQTQRQVEIIIRQEFAFLQFLMDGCHPQTALHYASHNSFFMVAKSLARKKLGKDAPNLHFFLVTVENKFLYPTDIPEDIVNFGKTIPLSSQDQEIVYASDRYVAVAFPVIHIIFNRDKSREEFSGYLIGVRSKEKITAAIASYYQSWQGPRFLPANVRVNFKHNEPILLGDLHKGVALNFMGHPYEFILLPLMRVFLLGLLVAFMFIWKYFGTQ